MTSMAAGRPRDQEGTKMSAGREEESGTNDGTSLRGERAADWAAVKIMSRRLLCL